MAVFNIHGGHAPAGKKGSGAVGIVNESIVDREIKDAVIAKLRALGHTVYDCTCENGGSATEVLKDICNKANAHTVDLDVSIHLNCYNGSAKGTEVLVYKLGGKAEQYAKNIVNSIAELGYTNRGVKVRNDLYYLKHTKNTALLIETFFCDNQEDVNRYNLDAMANAIVKGIIGEVTSSTEVPTPQPSEPDSGYSADTYEIIASDLIVRKTPGGSTVGHAGLTSDGKKHDKDNDGALDRGTRITVKEIYQNGNDIWGRCPSGWVCLKQGSNIYAVKADAASTPSNTTTTRELGTYEVTASDLSVRTGPGTNYPRKTYAELSTDAKKHDYDKDGCLNKGTRVTVKEWKDGFARIPSGWVSGNYLKKV